MLKHVTIVILQMMVISSMGCTAPQKRAQSTVSKAAVPSELCSHRQMRLRIQVAQDGTPAVVKIERSSGYDTMDLRAAEWVQKNWRWPAGKAGVYTVPMNFTLK